MADIISFSDEQATTNSSLLASGPAGSRGGEILSYARPVVNADWSKTGLTVNSFLA
ncbi:hypothetical protein TWF569_001991 [Orbilia oligospora]|nr:hypothetical protein TWF569_001991 [Orbilia oligospora]